MTKTKRSATFFYITSHSLLRKAKAYFLAKLCRQKYEMAEQASSHEVIDNIHDSVVVTIKRSMVYNKKTLV